VYILVYVSAAITPFSEGELVALLQQSRESNSRTSITGMLLYKDGLFMQAIEGQRENVETLMGKIKADPRHHRIHVVLQENESEREFEGWTMGFKCLDVLTAHEPGYDDFLNVSLGSEFFREEPSAALRLLRCFRDIGD